MGYGGSLCFKTVFGGFIIILLLVVGMLEQTHGRKTGTTLTAAPMAMQMSQQSGNVEHVEVVGKKKLSDSVVHPQLGINYMSKRKVPNGPDPIHNRKAPSSKRPPGTS